MVLKSGNKTKCMHFCLIHKMRNQPTLTLNGSEIPMTQQYKFLGNIQNNFPDHHHIYTDGSKQGMKVGGAAVFQNQELLKRLPNESSIYSAEAIAIDLAMKIIINHKSSKFIIYSDSKISSPSSIEQRYISSQDYEIKWTLFLKITSFLLGYLATLVYREMKGPTKLQKKHSRHAYPIQKFHTPT